MTYLLSADVGTSSLKALLLDERLQVVAHARRDYPTRLPGPGRAEQDADDWYRAFCAAAREVLSGAAVPARQVAAVAIDGMSSVALPVDAEGHPLRPALIWLDRRAEAEAARLAQALGPELLALAGNRSDPSQLAPKLMWLRTNEPAVYASAACFLQCNAFVVQRLTGAFTMDVSQAGLSLLCDVCTGSYATALLSAARVDRRKLPDVVGCTERVGTVTAQAARESGLLAGTPVVAGAMDNVAATLGLRVWQPGDAYVAAGTVTNVGVLHRAPPLDGRGLVYHHALGNGWLVNGGVDYGGAGLRWFRDILEGTDLEALGRLAEDTACGERALMFLPYMTGQRAPLWNDHASGVVLGITPDTERRHLVRMFMESVALGARHAFDALCGGMPARAALTGGITHSPRWVQIFADVTGIPLSVGAHPEVSALGTAVLAGLGSGLFRDPAEALARIPALEARTPAEDHRHYYDALYQVFRSAYRSVSVDLEALDALRREAARALPTVTI